MMNRVFLCVGVSRYTTKREFFVMTICPKFETITLWDLRLNCEFRLKGRISENEKHLLENMLMSENQLIKKENLLTNFEENLINAIKKVSKTKQTKDFHKEDLDLERLNSKSEVLEVNVEENQDEQEIIENQKIELMQRDRRANQQKFLKSKPSYDFLEHKKKEESRRLQVAKGGYQIAVHNFYFKGQKGSPSELTCSWCGESALEVPRTGRRPQEHLGQSPK